MKIYVICSVRKATEGEQDLGEKYVAALEAEGHEVCWPPREH